MRALILTALATLLTPTAPPPPIFDMVCGGDRLMLTGETSEKAGTWTGTLHFNLPAKVWCIDRCAEVAPILSIEPNGQLLLRRSADSGVLTVADPGERTFMHVDQRLVNGTREGIRMVGDCRVQPKEVFPAPIPIRPAP